MCVGNFPGFSHHTVSKWLGSGISHQSRRHANSASNGSDDLETRRWHCWILRLHDCFLSVEVHGSTCNQGQSVEERFIAVTSEEDIAKLNKWMKKYKIVSIDASHPKGVAGHTIVILTLTGTGSQEIMSSAEKQDLMEFAQMLYKLPYQ